MRIHLRPLTPLWTGDSSGISKELRVTGLIGSLRWWFEGIVRAMGRYACDPTEGGCQYQKAEGSFHGLCPACWVFGATGWSRRFRMTAAGLHATDWYILADPRVHRLHKGWLERVYKPGSKVLWGEELTLELVRHFPGHLTTPDVDVDSVMCALVSLIARFGALGAKPQNGFGAVEWRERPAFDGKALEEFVARFPKDGHKTAGMFNLAETDFLEFTIRDPGVYGSRAAKIPASANTEYAARVLPVAYDVRYKSSAKDFRSGAGQDRGLRPALKRLLARQAEDIIGAIAKSDDRTSSRVFVTHLYRQGTNQPYRMRIWVHIPPHLAGKRSEIKQTIKSFVVNEMFQGSTAVEFGWPEIQREVL